MIKKITFLFLLLCSSVGAQIINEPPYILTVDQLKEWTEDGPTADPIAIATQPILGRFINTDTQFNSALSNNLEIAFLPDGMNNFGNYGVEQGQFNLYNFTQWSYIDKLVWFGGTADQTVQIPSAPWTNTAHKNGVKVFGNIFFAPNAFGGSTETILNFLEQNGDGEFIVIPIMVEIMQYYNFDGWFINEETNTNASTGQLMYEFLRDLTTAVEAEEKEVMWYDAMLLNGNVDWQDRLNANNSPFVQNDQDGDPNNGFEQRVSSNIFINFFWGGTPPPLASRNRAVEIGRSEFDVFTGVDLWPGRNQGLFETVGNTWMGWIHEDVTNPVTSLGLFAPNCVYNNTQYSNFVNDPNDYVNFYSQERHMFAGADRNPSLEDASGFKGYANWIPASSTITQIPFETNFNTGHGLRKFEDGTESSSTAWHNLNDQDILPTWQFAFSENGLLGASWDFDLAYNGGNSLGINGTLLANDPVDIDLYKTQLLMTADSKIDIIYSYETTTDSQVELLLTFADTPNSVVALNVSPGGATGWVEDTWFLNAFEGRELAKIGLRFSSDIEISDYELSLGNLKVHEGPPLSISDNYTIEDDIVVTYPNSENRVRIYSQTSSQEMKIKLFNVQGQLVNEFDIRNKKVYNINTTLFSKGLYVLSFTDELGRTTAKKMIVR
ncbi:MAG: T9SS type A sorting domain-containing protein [Bacteroidetes bacterium]|nr:T9SS type A sorting domain-containing protein [Bacteroidota bacterium]